ncbi:hypothetical protein [Methylogaea oryzae]|nr:hypothetical protein [Methylogaea oryzae]
MIDRIFAISPAIRYVALYQNGQLQSRCKAELPNASSDDSDRYEELLVNPTLLFLTGQRGAIDCGGLDYLIVRYGNFFQFVMPTGQGHLSVCMEPTSDPVELGTRVQAIVREAATDSVAV